MPGPQQKYSPFSRFMGLDQIDEAPPVTIQGLRNAINKPLGIEEGSVLDAPMAGMQSTVNATPGALAAGWNSLSKAQPVQQAPYAGNKMGPFAPQGAVAGLNQAGPSDQTPTMNLQMPEDPLRGGSMSIQGGADLRSPGALDNFAALSKQFTPQRAASTEELYRAKYADPETRSPGAAAWANDELGQIPGTSEALGIEKMRQPIDVAQIGAQGGVRQQEIASQGQRDVANTTAQAARDTSPFGQFLKSGQQLPGNLRGVSKSGFTLGPEQQIPPGALSSLTNAMYAAAQNPTVGMFNKQPSPAAQSLNTAISNIMSFVPNSDQIAGFTDEVVNMPEYAKMQWNEILQATGETDLTPEEQLVFRALLQSKRGF